MKTYKFIILVLLAGLATTTRAQEVPSTLNVEDAVALTLAHNYSIRIAKNNEAISRNDAALGNAGYFPTVSLNGNYNYSVDDTRVEFANPGQDPIDATGAATTSYGASINLNYTIYAGGSRKFNYQKLKKAQEQGQLQERQAIEQSVLNVLTQYLNTVNFYDAYQTATESVKISQDRYNRAKEGYNFGSFSRLELLNAEVDLSNDSTSMFQAKLSYEKARKNLSNTMGVAPDAAYGVSNTFSYDENLNIDALTEKALQQNVDYLLARNAAERSELDLKLTGADVPASPGSFRRICL